MEVPARYHIFETENWLLNHRMNSALPGYVMVGSKAFTAEFSRLSFDAQAELGPLLAKTQNALKQTLQAKRVYIASYGHTPGFSFHFHVIPIYDWVEDLFWADGRYRALGNFAEGTGETATDGAEMTFFVWREFCERSVPPPIRGPSVAAVTKLLRSAMNL